MRVRFVGDPRNQGEGPDGLSLFGVDFIKGLWAEVDAAQAARFSKNDHFEVEGDPLDHDGDGKPGGSIQDPELAAMRQLLAERGIKFHHKAGKDKLQALLDAAGAQ